jgi:phosphoglycerate dehydrogenase-like enzyme
MICLAKVGILLAYYSRTVDFVADYDEFDSAFQPCGARCRKFLQREDGTIRVVFHYHAGRWLSARLAALAAEAGLDIAVIPAADREGLAAALPGAEAIWHVLEPLTAEHLAQAPGLRLVQKIGIGINTIAVEAAAARGVAVCNMPGSNSRAVAEMALTLMLACLRRLRSFDAATRDGRGWSLPADIGEGLGEIAGRTVGLLGFGAVPRLLAPILAAMGARVIYADPYAEPDSQFDSLALDALLGRSDIVSLHVPLTGDTEHLIDGTALARMKPGAILINTARGGLVDHVALAGALRDGRLAAAGLDVLATEPVDPGDPLLALDSVIVTPHVAWLTRETLARSLDIAVENCQRLRDGRPLLHQVA